MTGKKIMKVVEGNHMHAVQAKYADVIPESVLWCGTRKRPQILFKILVPTCPMELFSAIMNCPIVEKHI